MVSVASLTASTTIGASVAGLGTCLFTRNLVMGGARALLKQVTVRISLLRILLLVHNFVECLLLDLVEAILIRCNIELVMLATIHS